MVHAFRQGFQDAGYTEGRNILIEWRHAHGNYDQLPRLAAELVQSKVDVIVAGDTLSAQAAKRATTTIPIVMVHISDPVGAGLVTSLAHPGGNVTGLTIMTPDINTKRLQLLKETLPQATRIAVLWNPDTPFHPKLIEELKAAAPALSIKLTFVPVRPHEQFPPAFAVLRHAHAEVLYVLDDAFFASSITTILKLASQARLPVVYASKEYVRNGALMFYGVDHADQCQRAGGYVAKILNGTKPGDLPVEQPTQFVLLINMKTAKALGITIPDSILERADEVIR